MVGVGVFVILLFGLFYWVGVVMVGVVVILIVIMVGMVSIIWV